MKMSFNTVSKHQCSRLAMTFLLLAGILGFLPAGNAHANGNIIFVDADAGGTGTGASWANAYTDLQLALGVAGTGDQIWIAEGTYYPTMTADPVATFMLENGVAIYGGFAGTESLLTERNPKTNITILSGEIGNLLDTSDNSYHVVTGDGTGNTAVLNGFTITAGNATHDIRDPKGGGIHIKFGSPTLSNLVLMGNTADFGGGIYNYTASPTLTNISFRNNTAIRGAGMYGAINSNYELANATFENNIASHRGGGMTIAESSPTLKNVTFSGNSAAYGGGLHNDYRANSTLINVTFAGNTAGPNSGGAIYSEDSSLTIINTILYNNTGGEIYAFKSTPVITYSIVKGGYGGTGNLDADPLLGSLQENGGFAATMAPAVGSPAIDAGLDDICPDLDPHGLNRPQGEHCDIGAYEVDTAPPDVIIESHPFDLTASTSADFPFTANDDGGSGIASVECQLDGGSYGSCTSPKTYTLLEEGNHIFQVKVTDKVGNFTIAAFSWVVDSMAPDTTLDAHPSDPDTNFTPSFSFGGNDSSGSGVASYMCRVDGGTLNACTSPFTVSSLSPGSHKFSVYAIDHASNADPSPASFTWTITQIPTLVSSILRAGTSPSSTSSVAFTVKFSADVNGVDANDFSLATTGVSKAYVKSVSGSGDTYTVHVTTGLRSGSIRLDIPSSSDILDGMGSALTNLPYRGGESYSIVKTQSFGDVSTSNPYYDDIEILYANNLTAGCQTTPFKYCPDQIMDRAQSATFMMRATFGPGFVPHPVAYRFQDIDWSKGAWARPWAEAMREVNMTSGCKTTPLLYCPWAPLPREQVAIFALKIKYGKSYKPPAATGAVFADMTTPSYYATAWMEQAYKDGLIPPCATSGGKPKICPKDPVSRGLAAYIIVRAKNLSIP
jgi:predicted outer membrane repeat protein